MKVFSQSKWLVYAWESLHRCEVVNPAFVRPPIFTPFCFGSCRVSQQCRGLH